MLCLLTVLFCTWRSASHNQKSWLPAITTLSEQMTTFKFLGPSSLSVGRCYTCDQPNQVKGWGFLGLLFSGDILCNSGKTNNLHLHCLQAVLVPVSQYGCQVCGMHGPPVAAAKHACLDLQRVYAYDLGTICGLLPATPCRIGFVAFA